MNSNKIPYWITKVIDPDFGRDVDAMNYAATIGLGAGMSEAKENTPQLKGTQLAKGDFEDECLIVVGPKGDLVLQTGDNTTSRYGPYFGRVTPYDSFSDSNLKKDLESEVNRGRSPVFIIESSSIENIRSQIKKLGFAPKYKGEYTFEPIKIFD